MTLVKVFLFESSQRLERIFSCLLQRSFKRRLDAQQIQTGRAKNYDFNFSVKMLQCPKLDLGALIKLFNALKMNRRANLRQKNPHDSCYCDPDYSCEADPELADYEELWKESRHLDLEIRIDDPHLGFTVTRQVHILIMDVISQSFTQFAKERAFKYPNNTIDEVINFAYKRTMKVDESNVDDLLEIAHRFDMPLMKKYICGYIHAHLSLKNCMKNYHRAMDCLCSKDVDMIKAFILKTDFLELNRIECGFINEPISTLEAFIQDDRLGLNEKDVFDLVMAWIGINPERERLLNQVRFFLLGLDPDYYQSQIHQLGLRRVPKTLARNKKVKPRIPNEFVLAIGGWSSFNPDGPCGLIEVLNVRTGNWLKMKVPFPGRRAYHGSGVIGQKLYLFGGFDKGNLHSGASYCDENYSLDLKEMTWQPETPMNTRRCYVLADVLNDEIYAVGGFSGDIRLRSAERYNPETKQWTVLPPMAKIRSDAACVSFNGKLYVIGGFNGSEIHDTVEIYDPVRNEWTFGSPLQIPRSGVKAVVYREKIYVIGGYDGQQRLKNVEILDPSKSPRWKMSEAQMKTRRSNFTVSVVDGKIYVMGGYDGYGVTNRVESFSEDSNQWVACNSMKKARSALTSVTVSHYSLNFHDFI